MPRDPENQIFFKDIDIVWKEAYTKAITHANFIDKYRKLPEYATISVIKIREIELENEYSGNIIYRACTANEIFKVIRFVHDCKYHPTEEKMLSFNKAVTASILTESDIIELGEQKFKVLGVTSYEKCDWITILGLKE